MVPDGVKDLLPLSPAILHILLADQMSWIFDEVDRYWIQAPADCGRSRVSDEAMDPAQRVVAYR